MNILGIGAHPDDLEFGCGGTFIKLCEKKFNMHLLVITSGGAGGSSDRRQKEQKIAAKMINAKIHWGRFKDTEVPGDRSLIRKIEQKINEIRPDMVFTNYWEDIHNDHRNVAQAVITASRYVKDLLFYEVPSTRNFSPTVFVNIGPILAKKSELLKAHKSQINKTRVPYLSILESAKSTAIYRGYQARVKYAEGFMPYRFILDSCI